MPAQAGSGCRGDSMKRLFFILFLSASLSCFAQTTTSNGVAAIGPQTTTETAVPGPPQVVPSDVTLPGSGPPVGAPLTNSNTNDSRTGGIVQAYNPAAVVEHPVATSAPESLPAAGLAAGIPVHTGLQCFSVSARSSRAASPAL